MEAWRCRDAEPASLVVLINSTAGSPYSVIINPPWFSSTCCPCCSLMANYWPVPGCKPTEARRDIGIELKSLSTAYLAHEVVCQNKFRWQPGRQELQMALNLARCLVSTFLWPPIRNKHIMRAPFFQTLLFIHIYILLTAPILC